MIYSRNAGFLFVRSVRACWLVSYWCERKWWLLVATLMPLQFVAASGDSGGFAAKSAHGKLRVYFVSNGKLIASQC